MSEEDELVELPGGLDQLEAIAEEYAKREERWPFFLLLLLLVCNVLIDSALRHISDLDKTHQYQPISPIWTGSCRNGKSFIQDEDRDTFSIGFV